MGAGEKPTWVPHSHCLPSARIALPRSADHVKVLGRILPLVEILLIKAKLGKPLVGFNLWSFGRQKIEAENDHSLSVQRATEGGSGYYEEGGKRDT